jgi:hypothetical protein
MMAGSVAGVAGSSGTPAIKKSGGDVAAVPVQPLKIKLPSVSSVTIKLKYFIPSPYLYCTSSGLVPGSLSVLSKACVKPWSLFGVVMVNSNSPVAVSQLL